MMWEELPMASRARLMEAAVRNGYTDIRSIKEAYANFLADRQSTGNMYSEGGGTDDFEVVNLLDSILEDVVYDTEDTKDTFVPETHAYGGNLFAKGGKKTNNQRSYKNERRDYYKQQLIARGLRGAQLEAVLNNMEVESGYNPNAHNKSSGAHGLMQWLGKRKPKSWSEKDQLDYIAATYNKFGGNEWLDKKAYKRFNETTDPKEASYLFRRYWERPEASSWHATDKFYGKGSNNSYLPQETAEFVDNLLSMEYVEPKAPVFTEQDQKLLDTPALAFYNPEYDDRESPTYEKSKLMQDIALNESMYEKDRQRNLGLAFLVNPTAFAEDPWNMVAYSPSVSPEQKQALSNYQLFNMSGDDGQLYHGLSFAAYGGKVNRFDDGGYETQQEKILNRAKQRIDEGYVYNNYEDGVDASLKSKIIAPWTRFASNLKSIRIPALGSNCTLNASQWVNPRVPIISAATIENNPNQYGYIEIPEEYAAPGDMVIADNDNGVYHTMLLSGFAPEDNLGLLNGDWYDVSKGDPMVTYSKGKYGPENLIYNVPLAGYIDQSEGKTDVHYYRHPYEEGFEGLIPPLIVTPQGTGFDLTGPVDSIKHYIYPNR